MRVIDLLNKIANGEEVPEKFRFAGQIFEKQGSYIVDEDRDSIFGSMCTDFSNINEEIEIIEEQKEETKTTTRGSFEALGYACGEIQKCFINGWEKSLKNKSLNEEDKKIKNIGTIYFNETPTEAILHRKIEEIIDYINKEK